ncbi:MAG: DUF3253 domain-containing protein [Pseudomonadota bacterium]
MTVAQKAILGLLEERGAGKTICPSEAARRLSGAAWRDCMPEVRAAAVALYDAGALIVTQKGVGADPAIAKGAMRFGLPDAPVHAGKTDLKALSVRIRACRICASVMQLPPRPVFQLSPKARLLIAGQAPGIRAHKGGRPFIDPSGDRLRDWLQMDETTFYNKEIVAISPMGFCFPGYDKNGGDLPPRKECAPLWQPKVLPQLPNVELVLLVGAYAQRFHLNSRAKKSLTDTVKAWRDYGPLYLPLPHPSWRNNAWLKQNPWFSTEILPALREKVKRIVNT